jgi:hypothetical protein
MHWHSLSTTNLMCCIGSQVEFKEVFLTSRYLAEVLEYVEGETLQVFLGKVRQTTLCAHHGDVWEFSSGTAGTDVCTW